LKALPALPFWPKIKEKEFLFSGHIGDFEKIDTLHGRSKPGTPWVTYRDKAETMESLKAQAAWCIIF
jgi:hypothetical protein